MKRVRGEKPNDAEFITHDFRGLFGKGSTPSSDPANYPSPDQIRAVFDRVHQHVTDEIAAISDETLNGPIEEPAHRMFTTNLGALEWCACHEFIHAGQIALLRRLFGAEPLR